jgi:hypothetical protein
MRATGFATLTVVRGTFQVGGEGEDGGGVVIIRAREVVMSSIVRGAEVDRCYEFRSEMSSRLDLARASYEGHSQPLIA